MILTWTLSAHGLQFQLPDSQLSLLTAATNIYLSAAGWHWYAASLSLQPNQSISVALQNWEPIHLAHTHAHTHKTHTVRLVAELPDTMIYHILVHFGRSSARCPWFNRRTTPGNRLRSGEGIAQTQTKTNKMVYLHLRYIFVKLWGQRGDVMTWNQAISQEFEILGVSPSEVDEMHENNKTQEEMG